MFTGYAFPDGGGPKQAIYVPYPCLLPAIGCPCPCLATALPDLYRLFTITLLAVLPYSLPACRCRDMSSRPESP